MKWVLFLGLVCFPSFISAGFPRKADFSIPVFQHSGDSAQGISVAVGTTTKVNVYEAGATGVVDREVLLQNSSETYLVYCSTSATGFTATTGSRFILPKFPTGFTTNGNFDIWCLTEPSAGSGTVEINGLIEYNLND